MKNHTAIWCEVCFGILAAVLIFSGFIIPNDKEDQECNNKCILYKAQAGERVINFRRSLEICKCWTSKGKTFEFVAGKRY